MFSNEETERNSKLKSKSLIDKISHKSRNLPQTADSEKIFFFLIDFSS
jgi:hypothetical protein